MAIATVQLNILFHFTAHVAGGTHHAFKNYGEGFCIFSDIAVAANVILQRYSPSALQQQQSQQQQVPNNNASVPAIQRILIIDLDVHQGNGNAALFDGKDEVQTFSMHCSANYFSKKENSNLDVELPIGCGDETYLSTLNTWLKRMEEHEFDESQDAHEKGTSSRTGKRKQFDLIFFQAGGMFVVLFLLPSCSLYANYRLQLTYHIIYLQWISTRKIDWVVSPSQQLEYPNAML